MVRRILQMPWPRFYHYWWGNIYLATGPISVNHSMQINVHDLRGPSKYYHTLLWGFEWYLPCRDTKTTCEYRESHMWLIGDWFSQLGSIYLHTYFILDRQPVNLRSQNWKYINTTTNINILWSETTNLHAR